MAVIAGQAHRGNLVGTPLAQAEFAWCARPDVAAGVAMLDAAALHRHPLVTLPLAWPLQASTHDIGLLALLGTFQLALPCLLVVRLSRELPAPHSWTVRPAARWPDGCGDRP